MTTLPSGELTPQAPHGNEAWAVGAGVRTASDIAAAAAVTIARFLISTSVRAPVGAFSCGSVAFPGEDQ